MEALPQIPTPKKKRSPQTVETVTIKLAMLLPLFFSAWLTYHFVQAALLGLAQMIP